jgi:DNA-binding MarR family transcriptional regulator
MPFIDLVVTGSVAVNEKGARLGKGAGYADLEIALLVDAGLVTEQTTIATTVHELQVLGEEFPELPHDFRVDLLVGGLSEALDWDKSRVAQQLTRMENRGFVKRTQYGADGRRAPR